MGSPLPPLQPPAPHLWSWRTREEPAGQGEANPDLVISITGRWKIIWYLSLLKVLIPSTPKIFPVKLNKRGERSFYAHWEAGVVERKQAQQAESWWQCRQKTELLKILFKKWNLHYAGFFIWTSLTISLARSLSLSPRMWFGFFNLHWQHRFCCYSQR